MTLEAKSSLPAALRSGGLLYVLHEYACGGLGCDALSARGQLWALQFGARNRKGWFLGKSVGAHGSVSFPQEVVTQERIAARTAAAGWKPAVLSRGAVVPWEVGAFAA